MTNKEYKEFIQSVIDDIEAHLGYELSADPREGWTPDYKEGYIDGLKQALFMIKELK